MAKINKEEYEILKKDLKEGYEWIARDKSGSLYTHEYKVVKATESWLSRCFKPLDSSNLFQFIQWENEKPYNIQKLIDEYESSLIKATPWTPNPLDFNESEETEAKKDIEWLKEQINDINPYTQHTWACKKKTLELINQLDEPEVLSQDWIKDNQSMWTSIYGAKYYAPTNKLYGKLVISDDVEIDGLKNTLVPKQELPVVPKYIADWIEGYNWKLEKWKLPSAFRSDVKYKADQRLYEWANKKGNMDIFMKAILLGYEVEEEPKYVIDLDDEEISDGNHYLKHLEISEDGVNYLVCDSLNAMTFESEEEAKLIAEYVGGRVEELEDE